MSLSFPPQPPLHFLRSPHPNPPTVQLPQIRSHDQNQEPSPPPNKKTNSAAAVSVRSRISQLCKDGRLDLARRILFDSLPLSPTSPTLLFNALLIGYVSNSLPLHALRLYSLFNHRFPHRSDHYTYSSALKACADSGHLSLGRSVHCHLLRRSPFPPKNPVLLNSLLNMYASLSASKSDTARLLFDRMPRRNAVSFNTMIAWYARARRPAEALRLFMRMVESGIRPTVVSFVNVFPAVKSSKLADTIYGMLVKNGSGLADDVFVVSSAIAMYAEMSDVRSSRRVFDSARERNVEVWNTMIGCYVQNDGFEEAVELFVEVLGSDEVSADTVTFLNSLMAVSQMQDVGLGKQVHACLIKGGSDELPLILYNALVVMYSRCGCVQLAFDLFQQMPERDTVTWNTMISAFVQKELNLEALLLVYEMQKQGFAVDSVTVSALLSAASNLGSLRVGRETHGYLIRREIKCEGMESYLIDMYSKASRVEVARKLFDVDGEGGRDRVTWNAMVAGYTQNGQAEEALHLFRKMIDEANQAPNSVTLSSVLPACDPVGGGVQAGKQIHAFAVRQFLDMNLFVGTALVDMYSRCGEILHAERAFDGMAERSTVTYTTMLAGFGQHGLGQRALSLFRAMQESGIRPDAVTFVALLSACSYSGLVDEGLALYESMEEHGVAAAAEHACCVVDMLGRAGRVDEAYEFVQGLEDDCNNIGVWGSLLSACRVNQRFELAKLVSDRLFEMEKGGDMAGYHVLLSNVYAAEGKWESVNAVRKEMREKGLRKEPGLSWIDVGDASHRFMSRDREHRENDRIYAMLDELRGQMRQSGPKPADLSLAHGAPESD